MSNIKLRACLKELEKILAKYDAGGFIAIADSEGGEFKYVNPEWSVLKISKDGKVGIDTKRGWFKHRSKTHELSERTVHLLQVIEDGCSKGFLFSHKTLGQLKKMLDIKGGPIDIPPP